jgi:arsenate reductase (glutaredoxin)
MDKIRVYQKPTCTSCRAVLKILLENGITHDKVDYFIHPFSKHKLKELLKKMSLKASDILRSSERIYKELDLKHKNYSEDQLIELMVLQPDLIQRPIVEKGDKAVLARPPEKIKELF